MAKKNSRISPTFTYYYQFIEINDQFEDDLKNQDLEGYKFIYPEDEVVNEDSKISHKSTDISTGCEEEEDIDSFENADFEEQYYQQNDPVKKWQFQYNKSTYFSHNYPEIDYKEVNIKRISVAPGEGKIPSNILQEKDWDLKSFPTLLPDGKNSLHSERKVRLSEQDYFVQRLLNRDLRFACNTGYVFAAGAYIEYKQIEGRKGISFKRGKCSTSSDGTQVYSLDDPISVLDNVRNTPRYWQKMRYELNARLENIGPFSHFFTLSCADMRYPENFTPFLEGETLHYEVTDSKERVFVGEKKEPLMEFISRLTSKQDFIKRNLLNATLTFSQRVKMFLKHIIMNKCSPLRMKYYSYKVEFALRGAAHIHGVLWLDWDNLSLFSSDDPEQTKKKTLMDAFGKIKEEKTLDPLDKKAIAEFADGSITCTLKDFRTLDIVKEVQTHSHTKACRKYSSSCRFMFPRFPTLQTIVTVPYKKLSDSKEEQSKILENSQNILKKSVKYT